MRAVDGTLIVGCVMSLELNPGARLAGGLISLTLTGCRQTHEFDPAAQGFEARKKHAIASGQASPLKAVAAFLTLISMENKREGRAPDLIFESFQCVAAISPLNIDTKTLEQNLKRLERLGVILREPDGIIRVQSAHLLARIADSACVDAG